MFWPQRNVLQTNRLFLRYLLSYMLVLAIPLSIIVILVYNYFFHMLQEEVIKNNVNILQHVVTSVDHQIAGMNTIAYQIYNNPDLTTQQIGDGPYNTSKGIRQLKSYISGNNFISDTVVYYKQLNKFVSSTRTYTLKEFLSAYYGGTISEEQFQAVARDIDGNGVWVPDGASGGEMGHVVSYLIPNSSNYDKRMVLFIIKQHAFEQMMSSNKGNVLAINPERKIVAASKESNRPQEQDLMAIIQPDRIEHSVITKFGSSSHFVSYIQSPETGWSYFIVIPVKEAMSQVYAAKNTFLGALLIIVLAGGTAILFNMRLNYRPIRQLRLFAESETGSVAETGNEFEAVRMTINRINQTNKILKDQVTSNRSAVKEYLLSHLLSGIFPNAESFNEKGSDFGLSFNLPFFRVVIFSAAASEPLKRERASKLQELLEQAIPDEIEGYVRLNIDNRLILILASGRESDRQMLHDALTHMQQLLTNELHSHIAIGVGNPYEAAGQVGKSCLEAYTALDYRLVKGTDQIIYFEDIRIAAVSGFPYPVDELRALELSIIEGKTDRISFIVEELVDKITQYDIPLFEARCLCYDIINTVLKAMQQINKKFIGLDKGAIDVLSLAQFETVKELGQSITDVCQTLCKYIQDTREKHDDELLRQWVAYIETNYHDTNFTVQNMADHFNMSLSNLSYYFKKCSGQSISDYINYLRIEKAKQLLSSTEKPLIEIISEIGYCDVSSFVRKFKKEVGTTPGGFRKYNNI